MNMKMLLPSKPAVLDDGPDSAPPPIAGPLKIAGIVIITFLLIFLLWGFIAPLSKAAIAPGVLEVEGRRRVVQHLEGGIVSEILVREGDRVSKGQALIRLDTVQSGATAQAVQSEYLALLAEQTRLEAELRGAGSVSFPQEVAKASEARAQEIMQNQRALLETRRQALSGQILVLRESAAQARADIVGLQAQITSQTSQLQLLRSELENVSALVAEQLERRSRLLELQRAVASTEGQIASLRSQVSRAQRFISESNAKIAALGSERRDEVVTKLRDTQMRLAELREKLRAAKDVNQRRVIVAPTSGQVVEMYHSSVGGVVRPGEPVLDIVPDRQELVIAARVRPVDIENIHPGLATEIRLVPYSGRDVPMLHGEVMSVSEDVITSEGQDPYYAIQVRIGDSKALRTARMKLISGMPAEVYVLLGKRSFLQYLFQPLVDSFRRSFREA